MRKTLTLIFAFAIFYGCNNKPDIDDPKKRNENWCWFVDEHTGKGEWVPIGNKMTLENGDYSLFFCNGEIRKIGKLKNGKDCDTIFQFNLNGDLISKIFKNKNGELYEEMPDGKYKDYYPSCELRSEGEVKNNKHIGIRTDYYINGATKGTLWQHGDTSLYKSFYETGEKQDSSMSIKGKANGLAKYWFKNGQVDAIRYWKNDFRHGDFLFYFENGQLKQTRKFINDLPHDTVMDWHENGRLRFIKQYLNGMKIGEEKTWHENGNMRSVFFFVNDVKHGSYIMYHENGEILRKGKYKFGSKIGPWNYYDENGNLTKTTTYGEEESKLPPTIARNQ